jgi:hypothetical protein
MMVLATPSSGSGFLIVRIHSTSSRLRGLSEGLHNIGNALSDGIVLALDAGSLVSGALLSVDGGVGSIGSARFGHLPELLYRLRWAGSVHDAPELSHTLTRSRRLTERSSTHERNILAARLTTLCGYVSGNWSAERLYRSIEGTTIVCPVLSGQRSNILRRAICHTSSWHDLQDILPSQTAD